MVAELTAKAIVRCADTNFALNGKKLFYVEGTSAINDDFITIGEDMTTVKGAYLVASDGTVGDLTFATNVVTLTNGGALTWSGLVWGI